METREAESYKLGDGTLVSFVKVTAPIVIAGQWTTREDRVQLVSLQMRTSAGGPRFPDPCSSFLGRGRQNAQDRIWCG